MQDSPNFPDASLLIASLLLLMTKHAQHNRPRLHSLIIRQLEFLLVHPSEEITPALRKICGKLIDQWTISFAYSESQKVNDHTKTRLLH